MTICIELHLENKQVLIVGGGKVAFRKAKQFYEEGAMLTIISPDFLDDFKTIEATYINRRYEKEDCANKFYIYAATDNQQVNEEIIKDANHKNILCGCAMKISKVTSSSMQIAYDQDVLCAVSTKGSFPAWNKVLQKELSTVIENNYIEKAKYLKQIREYILLNKIEFQFWNEIAERRLEELKFIVSVLQKQSCKLYAFHGVVQDAILKQLYETMNTYEEANSKYAHTIVFLSDKVCVKLNHQISSLSQMVNLLKELGIFNIEVYPMLVSDGAYLQRVTSFCDKEQIKLNPILFSNQINVDEIIDRYVHTYPAQQLLFVTHDNFSSTTLRYLETSIARYKDVYFTSFQTLPTMNQKMEVALIPFVMLLGHHANKDILNGKDSVSEKLQQDGYIVNKVQQALFDQSIVLDKFKQ